MSDEVQVKKPLSNLDAEPTLSHRVLTALSRAGYLKHWIQQNHDGLPQKGGFPQHNINEIHGAWFDPSNPVVPMEGQLRGDLFQWLMDWEEKADVCLALGTSLSGMNADRVVHSTGKRAKKSKSGGAVIVALQRTSQDSNASLRIFAKIDDVTRMLAEELALEVPPKMHVPEVDPAYIVEEDVFLVPFDEHGQPSSERRRWDLREGSWVRIVGGPYDGDFGEMCGKNLQGHYKIRCLHALNKKSKKKAPKMRVLGSWWTESATQGHGIMPDTGTIPVVSADRPPEADSS